MTRKEALNYLRSSGMSDEQIKTVCLALTDEDCISREAAQKIFAVDLNKPDKKVSFQQMCIDAFFRLEELPRMAPKHVMGIWGAIEDGEMEVVGYYCSACDSPSPSGYKTAFCPECGAKMEGIE